jgi:hypothetical protein
MANAPIAAPVAFVNDQVPSRSATCLQHDICKPKSYTDGKVRWGMLAASAAGAPTSADEALHDQK